MPHHQSRPAGILAPSLLSADFAELRKAVELIEAEDAADGPDDPDDAEG